MGCEIVVLEDNEIQDQPVLTLLDDKLSKVLKVKSNIVALCLRPEIQCSTGFLEWLEAWSRRFGNFNKTFFIVPATPGQLECLEVSHPEMGLGYAATLDELHIIAPQNMEMEPASHAPLSSPVIDKSMDYSTPSVHMEVGSTVKLAGEYVCSMCRSSGMWLKGDKAATCENPECGNPSAGWDLVYELF